MILSTIAIENYRGIKQTCLKNLGKINVLCGKNNTGKSTILQAINESKKLGDVHVGFEFESLSKENTDKLIKDFFS